MKRSICALRPTGMRRTAWIWLAGCIAWTIDGLACLRYPNKQHAELAFIMAALFAIAWGFYRGQKQ